MRPTGRAWTTGALLTLALNLLVMLAVAGGDVVSVSLLQGMILAGVIMLYLVFPGSRLFILALANGLAVYTCAFFYFVEANFQPVEAWAVRGGFALPIIAFVGGSLWRRQEIRETALRRSRSGRPEQPTRGLAWLLPVSVIGAATFLLPAWQLNTRENSIALILAMGLIALLIVLASRQISVFLIDTGLQFEVFFLRVRRVLVPAFAFLTFYSLNIVVFASLYRLIDRLTLEPQFNLLGEARAISFAESLYFSVITISTVGYGEITPASHLVRLLVSIQIVLGVMLLLFGFYEIVNYLRLERHGDKEQSRRSDRLSGDGSDERGSGD